MSHVFTPAQRLYLACFQQALASPDGSFRQPCKDARQANRLRAKIYAFAQQVRTKDKEGDATVSGEVVMMADIGLYVEESTLVFRRYDKDPDVMLLADGLAKAGVAPVKTETDRHLEELAQRMAGMGLAQDRRAPAPAPMPVGQATSDSPLGLENRVGKYLGGD